MDKLTLYRQVVKDELTAFAELANRSPQAGAETLCVFDDARQCYILLNTGWVGSHRLRGNSLFLRIKGGKVWIEEDWTDVVIAERLVVAGIPKEDIVLGFQAPNVRPLTEFAVE